MVTLIGLSCAWAGFISGPLLAEEERRTLACPTLFLWRGGDAPEAEDDGPLVTDRPDFTEARSIAALLLLRRRLGR